MKKMESNFMNLPIELLSHIVIQIDAVKTLASLALTCRRLYTFVERDGFRLFVQNKFPSIQTPPYWKQAVHALTSASKAWDRKAFVSRSITFKDSDAIEIPWGKPPRMWKRGAVRAQTMGYQPVIDSYQEMGDSWISRSETLAWGAGAELILRSTKLTDRLDTKWMLYQEHEQKDGKHDITSLNLLRPSQWLAHHNEDATQVIIGRADGSLDRVHMVQDQSRVVIKYATDSRPVRSAAVNQSSIPLLAAGLSDDTVAIYDVNSETGDPVGETSVIPSGKMGRTWSTRFLNHKRLAVGLGPSSMPIHIYEIAPDRVLAKPLRQFGSGNADAQLFRNDDGASSGDTGDLASSVYPIVPLGASSSAGGADGDLFLSGWFSGAIRLHDLRSPASYCAVFDDPMDNSPIYSLLAIGRERFFAGAGRNCILKGFDLRVAGGRAYFAADASSCVNEPRSKKPIKLSDSCCNYHYSSRFDRRNFNLYVRPSSIPSSSRVRYRDRLDWSPIYSLSSPSAYSPTVYAGIEDSIIKIDLRSLTDKHPDPVFERLPDPLSKFGRGAYGNPQGILAADTLNLAIQEQSTTGKTPLMKQSSFAPLPSTHKVKEHSRWDERWEMPSNINKAFH